VVIVTRRPLYQWGKRPLYQLTRRLSEFHNRPGRFGDEKDVLLYGESNSDSLVAVVTELTCKRRKLLSSKSQMINTNFFGLCSVLSLQALICFAECIIFLCLAFLTALFIYLFIYVFQFSDCLGILCLFLSDFFTALFVSGFKHSTLIF